MFSNAMNILLVCLCIQASQQVVLPKIRISLHTSVFLALVCEGRKRTKPIKRLRKQAVLAFNLHSLAAWHSISHILNLSATLGPPCTLVCGYIINGDESDCTTEQDRSPLHPPLGTQELLKRIRLIATPHVFRTLTEGALLPCSQV